MTELSWFAHGLMEVSPPAHFAALLALEDLLKRLRPAALDPSRSYAIDGQFHLAHRIDEVGNIDVHLSSGATYVDSTLTGPQDVLRTPSEDEAGWIGELVEEVATILSGTYVVETVTWGDRPVRTVVHGPEYRHQTGPLRGLLPVPGRLLTVTRRDLTYDCRGTWAGGT